LIDWLGQTKAPTNAAALARAELMVTVAAMDAREKDEQKLVGLNIVSGITLDHDGTNFTIPVGDAQGGGHE
jgi:hypothetical protein